MKKIAACLTPVFLFACSPQQEDGHQQPSLKTPDTALPQPSDIKLPTIPHKGVDDILRHFRKMTAALEQKNQSGVPDKAPNLLTSAAYESHNVIASAATLNAMRHKNGFDLNAEISRMAGQDVILLDSNETAKIGLAEWNRLPLWETAAQLGIETDSATRKALLMDMRTATINAKETNNYFSMNLNGFDNNQDTACIITGQLQNIPSDHALMLGNINKSWRDFVSIKNYDAFSYRVLLLLHETAHCTQKNMPLEAASSFDNDTAAYTLYGEIDADSKAIEQYQKLIEQGWPLNPEMVNSLKHLRMVAPIMETLNAPLTFTLNGQFTRGYSHATGNALLAAPSDIDYKNETTTPAQLNVLLYMIGYQLMNDAQKKNVEQEAGIASDKLRRDFEKDLKKTLGHGPQNADVIKALIDSLMPGFSALQVFQTYANKHPEIIIEALSVINRHEILNEDPPDTKPENVFKVDKVKEMAVLTEASLRYLLPSIAEKAAPAQSFDDLFEYDEEGAIIAKRLQVFVILANSAKELEAINNAAQQKFEVQKPATPQP